MRPHRRQPTRLPHSWDSPGKNTGVGCHFLLQCMKVKSESEVTQSCPTLRDPMDCSLPGSSTHGIFQARVLEWGAIVAQLYPTLCHPMKCSTPCFPVHHQLPELAQLISIKLVKPSNHLFLCPLFLLLPSIFPRIRVFQMSQFFTSDGPSIGVSASVLSMNIQN